MRSLYVAPQGMWNRISLHMCFAGVFLACWHQGSLGDTSVANPENIQEGSGDCAHKVAGGEQDEASMLQLTVSAQEEHLKVEAIVKNNHPVKTDHKVSDSTIVESGESKVHDKHILDEALNLSVLAEQNRTKSLLEFNAFALSGLISTRPSPGTQLMIFGVLFVLALSIITCAVLGTWARQRQGAVRTVGPPRSSPRLLSPSYDSLEYKSPAVQHSPGPSPGQSPSPTPVLPGTPLCEKLMIPGSARLLCKVPRVCKPQRQSLEFSICSQASEALFNIIVDENQSTGCGVSIEDMAGQETIAILSTDAIWSSSAANNSYPALNILRPSGAVYGNVQRVVGNGGLVVMQGQRPLITLAGDWHKPKVQAFASDGTFIASTQAVSSEEYHLYVHANVDAGLVVLAMLAGDKLGLSDNSQTDI